MRQEKIEWWGGIIMLLLLAVPVGVFLVLDGIAFGNPMGYCGGLFILVGTAYIAWKHIKNKPT